MTQKWTLETDTPKPDSGVDYRTVKAWFQQCRDLAAAIEAQKQKIQRIRDAAEKCTQSLSGMPAGGGNGDKVGFAVEQLDTERRQLQRMETDLCNLRVEATRRAYCLMAEPECAEAICEHYVTGKSHKEIAKEVGVCGSDVVYRRIKRGCMPEKTLNNGLTWQITSDGTVTANGTANGTSYYNSDYFSLPAGTYTISAMPYFRMSILNRDVGDTTVAAQQVGQPCTFTVETDIQNASLFFDTSGILDNVSAKPQIEKGTTATTYAPYTGQTATLTLPRTIYGGTVDTVSSEGQETRKLLTLDGTEKWMVSGKFLDNKTDWYYVSSKIPNAVNHLKDEMCDELMELTDKKNRSPGDVEMIGEIVDIILDIHRIEDYCEGGEYSRAGEWEADMRGSFNRDAGNGYNRGNSYANRGRHYVRGHYSRADGRERMISDIEDMMQEATGAERDAYKRAADILRNA